jgi:hypothetical protein
MERYIKLTDDLLQELIDACNPHTRAAIKVKGVLKNIPTADVAEVVRCEDCESYLEYTFCEHMGLNGFCSYGRRKENG